MPRHPRQPEPPWLVNSIFPQSGELGGDRDGGRNIFALRHSPSDARLCPTESEKNSTLILTVKAHFDGTGIIPDEPLQLTLNEPRLVRIEHLSPVSARLEESALSWLAENAVDDDTLPPDLADRHDHYLSRGQPKDR